MHDDPTGPEDGTVDGSGDEPLDVVASNPTVTENEPGPEFADPFEDTPADEPVDPRDQDGDGIVDGSGTGLYNPPVFIDPDPPGVDMGGPQQQTARESWLDAGLDPSDPTGQTMLQDELHLQPDGAWEPNAPTESPATFTPQTVQIDRPLLFHVFDEDEDGNAVTRYFYQHVDRGLTAELLNADAHFADPDNVTPEWGKVRALSPEKQQELAERMAANDAEYGAAAPTVPYQEGPDGEDLGAPPPSPTHQQALKAYNERISAARSAHNRQVMEMRWQSYVAANDLSQVGDTDYYRDADGWAYERVFDNNRGFWTLEARQFNPEAGDENDLPTFIAPPTQPPPTPGEATWTDPASGATLTLNADGTAYEPESHRHVDDKGRPWLWKGSEGRFVPAHDVAAAQQEDAAAQHELAVEDALAYEAGGVESPELNMIRTQTQAQMRFQAFVNDLNPVGGDVFRHKNGQMYRRDQSGGYIPVVENQYYDPESENNPFLDVAGKDTAQAEAQAVQQQAAQYATALQEAREAATQSAVPPSGIHATDAVTQQQQRDIQRAQNIHRVFAGRDGSPLPSSEEADELNERVAAWVEGEGSSLTGGAKRVRQTPSEYRRNGSLWRLADGSVVGAAEYQRLQDGAAERGSQADWLRAQRDGRADIANAAEPTQQGGGAAWRLPDGTTMSRQEFEDTYGRFRRDTSTTSALDYAAQGLGHVASGSYGLLHDVNWNQGMAGVAESIGRKAVGAGREVTQGIGVRTPVQDLPGIIGQNIQAADFGGRYKDVRQAYYDRLTQGEWYDPWGWVPGAGAFTATHGDGRLRGLSDYVQAGADAVVAVPGLGAVGRVASAPLRAFAQGVRVGSPAARLADGGRRLFTNARGVVDDVKTRLRDTQHGFDRDPYTNLTVPQHLTTRQRVERQRAAERAVEEAGQTWDEVMRYGRNADYRANIPERGPMAETLDPQQVFPQGINPRNMPNRQQFTERARATALDLFDYQPATKLVRPQRIEVPRGRPLDVADGGARVDYLQPPRQPRYLRDLDRPDMGDPRLGHFIPDDARPFYVFDDAASPETVLRRSTEPPGPRRIDVEEDDVFLSGGNDGGAGIMPPQTPTEELLAKRGTYDPHAPTAENVRRQLHNLNDALERGPRASVDDVLFQGMRFAPHGVGHASLYTPATETQPAPQLAPSPAELNLTSPESAASVSADGLRQNDRILRDLATSPVSATQALTDNNLTFGPTMMHDTQQAADLAASQAVDIGAYGLRPTPSGVHPQQAPATVPQPYRPPQAVPYRAPAPAADPVPAEDPFTDPFDAPATVAEPEPVPSPVTVTATTPGADPAPGDDPYQPRTGIGAPGYPGGPASVTGDATTAEPLRRRAPLAGFVVDGNEGDPRPARRPHGSYPRAVAHRETVEYGYNPTTGEFTARVVSASEPVVTTWDDSPPAEDVRDVGTWELTPTRDGVAVEPRHSEAKAQIPPRVRAELSRMADEQGGAASVRHPVRVEHDIDARDTTSQVMRPEAWLAEYKERMASAPQRRGRHRYDDKGLKQSPRELPSIVVLQESPMQHGGRF